MNSSELDTLHIWVLDELVGALDVSRPFDEKVKAERRVQVDILCQVRDKCVQIKSERPKP